MPCVLYVLCSSTTGAIIMIKNCVAVAEGELSLSTSLGKSQNRDTEVFSELDIQKEKNHNFMHIQGVPTGLDLCMASKSKEHEKLITDFYLLSLRKVACTAKEIYHKK